MPNSRLTIACISPSRKQPRKTVSSRRVSQSDLPSSESTTSFFPSYLCCGVESEERSATGLMIVFVPISPVLGEALGRAQPPIQSRTRVIKYIFSNRTVFHYHDPSLAVVLPVPAFFCFLRSRREGSFSPRFEVWGNRFSVPHALQRTVKTFAHGFLAPLLAFSIFTSHVMLGIR